MSWDASHPCLGPYTPGEGGAAAPGEGSPPHDFANRRNRGAGSPHPALSRHLVCSLSMNKISVRQIVAT
jgi:hypothetical protein